MKSDTNTKFILCILLGTLTGSCTNNAKENISSNLSKNDSTSLYNSNADTLLNPPHKLSNEVLKAAYILAINDYIKTVHIKDKIQFDTLYFGKHVFGQADDFPDIELPKEIANTQIRLIDPEPGLSMQQKNKALVYINMMGWVDQVNASFILVNFSNGGQHQYDYFIDYNYNSTSKQYELLKIAIEDYRKLTENKPKHILLYEDGKYTFK